jgi:hypothetical protein
MKNPKISARATRKIRSCFFKADESKMVNCVSVLAAAQHIEASNKRNH